MAISAKPVKRTLAPMLFVHWRTSPLLDAVRLRDGAVAGTFGGTSRKIFASSRKGIVTWGCGDPSVTFGATGTSDLSSSVGAWPSTHRRECPPPVHNRDLYPSHPVYKPTVATRP
ncbi:unnamed protein product, partial [Discosporangium mesarthrocarpum]